MGKYRTENNLVCYWCEKENDINGIKEMFKAFKENDEIHWTCDHCQRKSRVKKSVKGFYNLYPADRARYARNVIKGSARLITLAEK